ncbi:MAG TPA: glycosyltransferase [Candidatus Coprenecus pullistercoris]|nr:glycosyltransferase [Candidatus Coprenecus pullistercoris]
MNIEFYFGNTMGDVKKMDYSLLKHKVTEVRNKRIGPIEWQTGIIKLAFKQYDKYIMLGGPMTLSTWICTLIARIQGKKVYYWSHGWYGKESKLERLIKKIFFRLPNGLLLYGNYAKMLMLKEGFKESKMTVIFNSLSYDKQLAIRQNLQKSSLYEIHFGNRNPVVIFIGRLTPVKKLDMILYAQKKNKEDGMNFNVTFIGDGSERINLELLSRKLELENNVWFYGASYNESELSQIIYDADLCVAPGNIGLTAVHAMTYGCPCISHNDFKWQMPEFEAIHPNYTGAFFKKDNIESLSITIRNWFKNNQNRRDEIRNNCYAEIDKHWNPHKQLDIIINAIHYNK